MLTIGQYLPERLVRGSRPHGEHHNLVGFASQLDRPLIGATEVCIHLELHTPAFEGTVDQSQILALGYLLHQNGHTHQWHFSFHHCI